ncbi:hypothetical protein SBADM41S_07292 [Streptomyces badius]
MKCSPGTPSDSSFAQNSVANSMPMERTAAGSSLAARMRSFNDAGTVALLSWENFSNCFTLVRGMTSGITGVSQPAATTRSRIRR